MWKLQKFSLTYFWQKFRESNIFTKEVTKELISRNIFWFFHTAETVSQCGNYGNSLSHIFVKNFVKVTVLLNKLLKSWFDEIIFRWERISLFSTLWVWKNEKFSLTQKIFRQISSLVTYLVKQLLSRNFYQKCYERISVISTMWVWK